MEDEETLQISENSTVLKLTKSQLAQWIFKKVQEFVKSPILFTPEDNRMESLCRQNGLDGLFTSNDSESKYNTIISLNLYSVPSNHSFEIKAKTVSLETGGHLLLLQRVKTALYNEGNKGLEFWNGHNKHLLKIHLENSYEIKKIRYF